MSDPAPFVLQIDETTTLGQIQVVIAALGVDMSWTHRDGLYHVRVFTVRATAAGKNVLLAQAIREAILNLRAREAVHFVVEGAPYR